MIQLWDVAKKNRGAFSGCTSHFFALVRTFLHLHAVHPCPILPNCHFPRMTDSLGCSVFTINIANLLRRRFLICHATLTPPKTGCAACARRLRSWRTKKKVVNESPKYKCFVCSSRCSANERICIFWKCLIVSVNQGYILNRRKERHSELTLNKLNRAKLLIIMLFSIYHTSE